MTRQRVLSLDLDFFVSPVKLGGGIGRLDGARYSVWEPEAVREWLHERALLTANAPLAGCIASHHDEAFRWWQRLIADGRLRVPFEVVHVDAHADLGIGDDGFVEIIGTLTHLPLGERAGAITRLEEGNFLAYAAVCGWLSGITYVTHPGWTGRDLHFMHFADYDDRCGELEFKRVPREVVERETARFNNYLRPYEADVRLPFRIVAGQEWTAGERFDFVFCCLSPEYTPPAADRLVEVVRECLRED